MPPHPTSERSISVMPSHLCLGLPNGLFPLGLPTTTLFAPLLSPIRLRTKSKVSNPRAPVFHIHSSQIVTVFNTLWRLRQHIPQVRWHDNPVRSLWLSRNHDTFVLWASAVHYLGLLIGSELLYTKHLNTVANKATGVLCNIFPPSPEIQRSHIPPN